MYSRSHIRLVNFLFGLIVFLSLAEQVRSADPADAMVTLKSKWTVLHLEKKPSTRPKVIPNQSPLQTLFNLEFNGSQIDQPFLLGKFKSSSAWFIQNGYLQPVEAKNSAIQLGIAENFELQGIINAEGTGGWYILTGWHQQSGYMLSAVTLRQSGSPWHLEEIRNGQGLAGTHQEIFRHDWKGDQRFRLSVKDKALTLKIGKETLLDKQLQPQYQTGAIIVGGYETPYGPKPLKIRSMRVRAR